MRVRRWLVVGGLGLASACNGSGGSAELGEATGDVDTTTGMPSTTAASSSSSSGAVPADSGSSGHGSSDGTSGADTTGAGSESTGGPQVCGDATGPLEIGHGIKEFQPLDAHPAELLHGPQGGVHITLGIRCPGLDVSQFGDVQLRGVVDGEVVADHPQGAVLNCDEALGVAEGLWLSMVFEVGPEQLHNRMIDLELTVTDNLGRSAMAQAQTLIWDPELAGDTGTETGTDTGTETGTSTSG